MGHKLTTTSTQIYVPIQVVHIRASAARPMPPTLAFRHPVSSGAVFSTVLLPTFLLSDSGGPTSVDIHDVPIVPLLLSSLLLILFEL